MERDQALKFMQDLLRAMASKKASDLFITAGFPPAIKIDGRISPVANQPLSPQHTSEIARAMMNDKQAAEFESTKECNFAVSPAGIGRFRVSAFVQQGRIGMVLRTINTSIPKFEELNLPSQLRDICMMKRGLVIMIGGTGQGKSTSLAAMVGYRNDNSYGHIITVEDPVEYVHDHKNCVVTQRDVGVDTESWYAALRNALRQAPDVILIGEIRDRQRQVDVDGVAFGLPQREQLRPHHHGRGPCRIRARPQELRRYAARRRGRHRFVVCRAQERVAPGARRDPDRRDP